MAFGLNIDKSLTIKANFERIDVFRTQIDTIRAELKQNVTNAIDKKNEKLVQNAEYKLYEFENYILEVDGIAAAMTASIIYIGSKANMKNSYDIYNTKESTLPTLSQKNQITALRIWCKYIDNKRLYGLENNDISNAKAFINVAWSISQLYMKTKYF